MKKILVCSVFILIFINLYSKAIFEPLEENKIILIVGQDLGAIGGFGDLDFSSYGNTENSVLHNDGYSDHLPMPAGVTTYLNPALGQQGLTKIVNYGSGDICAACITDNPLYDNTALSIGFYMVGELEKINNGFYDTYFKNRLIPYLKSINRPVFLRLGYEFDGEWNAYEPTAFINAWRYIVDLMRAEGLTNVAYVWQSSGYNENVNHLMQWYPGDEYVDWLGFSLFWGTGDGICSIARTKNKPVMVAEAAPMSDVKLQRNPEIWDTWYENKFFSYIYSNIDVIKAVAYINVDWNSQPMWAYNPPAQPTYWGDSRVQVYEAIKENWLTEINKDFWLSADESFFEKIYLPTSVKETKLSSFNAYYDREQKYIKFSSPVNGKLEIYDLQGNLLKQEDINISEKEKSFFIEKTNALVLLRFISENQSVYSFKVLVN